MKLLCLVAIVSFSWLNVVAVRAMTFTLAANATVLAVGPIETGDAIRFAVLPPFKTLELDSLGGSVDEALSMAAEMDARGGIKTVIIPGARCASACGMALFVSGKTRVVYWGGHLGIHSCRTLDGTPSVECNKRMARNAVAHGVPWGVIEGFGDYTKPSDMLWLGAEESECWGLIKWSAEDTSNDGIACYKWSLLTNEKRMTEEVTSSNADPTLCRMNAGTSLIHVPTGSNGEGFSDVYRRACERVATAKTTPKYAAIDILMWLTLTDPQIKNLKPGTLTAQILDGNEAQFENCWKCYTIAGMSMLMLGRPRDALTGLQNAVRLVERDTGSAPGWLSSRVDIAAKEAAMGKH